MESQLVQDAEALRDLLSPRHSWTKGDMALDWTGRVVGPCEEEAVAFCVLGGIRRVTGQNNLRRYLDLRNVVCEAIEAPMIGDWNDAPWRTHRQVKKALRRAVRLAKDKTDGS